MSNVIFGRNENIYESMLSISSKIKINYQYGKNAHIHPAIDFAEFSTRVTMTLSMCPISDVLPFID